MKTEKENIRKELREITPGLENYQGTNPFTIPEGYFVQLSEQIHERRIPSQKSVPVFFQSAAVRFALAGFIMLVGLVAGVLLLNPAEEKNLTEAETEFFNQHLAWYSDYQPEYYYDIIAENGDLENDLISDEQLMEYLMFYSSYQPSDFYDIIGD